MSTAVPIQCWRCALPIMSNMVYIDGTPFHPECQPRPLYEQAYAPSPTPQDERLRNAIVAAIHALRSFQYGNDSEEFAKENADRLEAALSALDARDSQSSLGDPAQALRQGAAGAPSETER